MVGATTHDRTCVARAPIIPVFTGQNRGSAAFAEEGVATRDSVRAVVKDVPPTSRSQDESVTLCCRGLEIGWEGCG
jgi:hypothetical protein